MIPERRAKLPFSAAILAGGKSSRMGRNKSMLEINEVPVIRRIADTLGDIFSEVLIIANEKAEYERMGLAVAGDIHPGNDSLGGLHTAVSIAGGSHVFVAGCDMPLLQPDLIYGVASLVDDWDVVVPVKNNYPEPLCAFYGKKCEPAIEESISRGDLKMISFHDEVRVRKVEEVTWRLWDPQGTSFLNANTPEEFEKIRTISTKGEAG